MKKCSQCQLALPSSQFHNNKAQADGKQAYCKDCGRKYHRACKQRKWLAQRDWMRELKAARGCARCPEKHPVCLDFHHVEPDAKSFKLSHRGYRSSQALLAEVEKCVVLCANCHRKEHYVE